MDIGAANFSVTDYWGGAHECNLTVHLFEPDAGAAAKLRDLPSVPSVTLNVHEIALASSARRLQLHLCRKREVSSALKPNRALLDQFPHSSRFDVEMTVEVDALPLDSILPGIPVDFIKLDVQGFELDVLHGAELTLEGALGLQVEVEFQEIYQNQPLFHEVDCFLQSRGFEFFDFKTIYRYDRMTYPKPKGQALAADAIYLSTRPPSRFNVSQEEFIAKARIISIEQNIPEIFDFFISRLSSPGYTGSNYG